MWVAFEMQKWLLSVRETREPDPTWIKEKFSFGYCFIFKINIKNSFVLTWGYHQGNSGPDICVSFGLWKLSLDSVGAVGSPEGDSPCWNDT